MGSSTPEEALLAGRRDLEAGVHNASFAAQYRGALLQLNILGDGSCSINQAREVVELSGRAGAAARGPAPAAAAAALGAPTHT